LPRFFSSFPDGRPGVGLILLRVAVCIALAIQSSTWLASSTWLTIAAAILSLLAAVLLLGGLMTPFAGTLAFFLAAFGSATFVAALVAAAIVLLGPGAYSIDARIFGRREIVIADAAHHRKVVDQDSPPS
jgi:hypothetical protein